MGTYPIFGFWDTQYIPNERVSVHVSFESEIIILIPCIFFIRGNVLSPIEVELLVSGAFWHQEDTKGFQSAYGLTGCLIKMPASGFWTVKTTKLHQMTKVEI